MLNMKHLRIIIDNKVVPHKSFVIRGTEVVDKENPFLPIDIITKENQLIQGYLLSIETVAENQFHPRNPTIYWSQFSVSTTGDYDNEML